MQLLTKPRDPSPPPPRPLPLVLPRLRLPELPLRPLLPLHRQLQHLPPQLPRPLQLPLLLVLRPARLRSVILLH